MSNSGKIHATLDKSREPVPLTKDEQKTQGICIPMNLISQLDWLIREWASLNVCITARVDVRDDDRFSSSNREDREPTRGKLIIEPYLLEQRRHHAFNQVAPLPRVSKQRTHRSHKHKTNTQNRQLYGAPVKK